MLTPALRRKAFPAAVRAAGYHSVDEWCEERDYSTNHIRLVLKGRRPSVKLQTAIDTFIQESIAKLAAELKVAA